MPARSSSTAPATVRPRFNFNTAGSLWLAPLLFALALVIAAGCSRFGKQPARSYQTLPDQPQRDAENARKLNTQGLLAQQKGDLEKAEQYFREALATDVDYGPAHNNLGQVYYQKKQMYLAAWEFELAANLMPTRSQAPSNLGLVYETAGQLERALPYYEAALELAPNDPNAIGNLARLCVKLDVDASRVNFLLNQVVIYDDRESWVHWAKELLATKYRIPASTFSEGSVEHEAAAPELIEALPLPLPQSLPVPEPIDASHNPGVPQASIVNASWPSPLAPPEFPEVPASFSTPANAETK